MHWAWPHGQSLRPGLDCPDQIGPVVAELRLLLPHAEEPVTMALPSPERAPSPDLEGIALEVNLLAG